MPPVDAPFRLIFRDRRLDRTRKFTKPLLYRLSYVGAYLRMIWHVLNDEARVAKTPAPLVNPTAVVFLDKFDHAERLTGSFGLSRVGVRGGEFSLHREDTRSLGDFSVIRRFV